MHVTQSSLYMSLVWQKSHVRSDGTKRHIFAVGMSLLSPHCLLPLYMLNGRVCETSLATRHSCKWQLAGAANSVAHDCAAHWPRREMQRAGLCCEDLAGLLKSC